MIYHDYLLRLIEHCVQALAHISQLKQSQKPHQAARAVHHELQVLLGADPASLLKLSTSELLARIIRAGSLHEVRTQSLFLVALFKELGDLAAATDEEGEGHRYYLKALQLLLDLLGRPETADVPPFVPTVEALLVNLSDADLPADTQAVLMQHFESIGAFDKAEDRLFALRASLPAVPELVDLGVAFYRRLLALNDAALASGNLPRAEVESGLSELQWGRI